LATRVRSFDLVGASANDLARHDHAVVGLAVQDLAHRRDRPRAPGDWRRHLFVVQHHGDSLEAHASHVRVEDPAHDHGLGLVHHERQPDLGPGGARRLLVAVRHAADDKPGLEALGRSVANAGNGLLPLALVPPSPEQGDNFVEVVFDAVKELSAMYVDVYNGALGKLSNADATAMEAKARAIFKRHASRPTWRTRSWRMRKSG
jgi:hypothetical protein